MSVVPKPRTESTEKHTVKSAFGAKNRSRLIGAYFSEQAAAEITPSSAWAHVYRLLLWVDQTTGLSHCYESDKSQPGKRWYARSLAFHDWVASALGTTPAELSTRIDWLFLRAADDLAAEVLRKAAKLAQRAELQRKPYEGRGFPRPGEDPELVAIIKEELGDHLDGDPTPEGWSRVVQRIRQYLALDNKRKNLVGECFEDVIAEVIRRICPSSGLQIHTRRALNDIPGFNRGRSGDKPNKVDVSIVRPSMRTLVTAKWSVRADREKQFTTDFTEYVTAESDRKPFEYVFVTNEFDPARLMRACEQLTGNALMFTSIVHISTDAIKAAYKPRDGEASSIGSKKQAARRDRTAAESEANSMQRVLKHIEDGRLISLEQWLIGLASGR